jgi:hypothetical protein
MALQPFVGPWPILYFRNLFTQSVGLLGRGISMSQGLYLQTGQHKHRINAHTDIHASSGIEDHDPSFRASEDSSCLRLRGPNLVYPFKFYKQYIPVNDNNNNKDVTLILRVWKWSSSHNISTSFCFLTCFLHALLILPRAPPYRHILLFPSHTLCSTSTCCIRRTSDINLNRNLNSCSASKR